MRALVLALCLLACSSSPDPASTEPDGGAGAAGAAAGASGAAGDSSAGAAGAAGAGGIAGAAGSPSSGGTAGAPVGGAGGSSGAGGSGGGSGSGGSSGGGAGGTGTGGAGGTGGSQQCPEACVASVTFNWAQGSGPPNAQGYGKAYSDCPAGSTFDTSSTDLSALYCFDCAIAKPSHVAATGQYVCTADVGAAVGSCSIHFRCKATNWCVPLAKPCP